MATVNGTQTPPQRKPALSRVLFSVGASVQMVGDEWSGLDGSYTVTDVGPEAVTLGGAAGQSVVLSPRHPVLFDDNGKAVDRWIWCNVFAEGAHVTNGFVSPAQPPGDLVVELGS